MKVWIDFINSPQVSFFEPLINELSSNEHDIILTCRDSGNTVDLIKQRNWSFTIIGKGAKKTTIHKLLSFPERIFSLLRFLKNKKIDVAICQSSFYLPIATLLLGIPSIYTNDNEHALGNIPAFLFATKVFIPENLSISEAVKKGAKRRKIFKYPGIKEGVYLWTKGIAIQKKRASQELNNKKIYVRPEPLTAQYYTGKFNFLDPLLLFLKEKYTVVILTREKSQLVHYKQKKFLGIEVPEHPLAFEKIAENCLLFIGAGGSMTREMALMGIPTISVYQGELLAVDKFLLSEKLMVHKKELRYNDIEEILSAKALEPINTELIHKGREAYQLFKQALLEYNKQ